jgi:hypothetical protein
MPYYCPHYRLSFPVLKPVFGCNLIPFHNFSVLLLLEIVSIHIHLVYTSLAHYQSIPNFCNYQIVVSITINPSEKIRHQFSPLVANYIQKRLTFSSVPTAFSQIAPLL